MNRRLSPSVHTRYSCRQLRLCSLSLGDPPFLLLSSGRYFSRTRSQSDNFINHYEILKVSPNCSQADLKKQFYALSRVTHPDINKSDPEASSRFSQISESYSTLGDPERRKCYDRDVFRVHVVPSRPSSGSYSRGGMSGGNGGGGSYAGSRPASGLSKRRGTFRGPPPSFYAHGGGRDSPRPNSNINNSSSSRQNSEAGSAESDFDPDPIARTQTQEDLRRNSRREAAHLAAQQQVEEDEGFWPRFIVVSGLLIGGLSVGGIFLGVGGSSVGRGGLVKGDGSRRDKDRAVLQRP